MAGKDNRVIDVRARIKPCDGTLILPAMADTRQATAKPTMPSRREAHGVDWDRTVKQC